MADDDGYQAGSAYVQVLPDFRGFHKSIQKSLQDEIPTFETFGDKWGKAAVDGFTERLKVGFEHLPEAKLKASVDTADVDAKLDKASRDRKTTIFATVKEVGGNAKELLGSKVTLGALGAAALGPQALGLGALGAGLGVAAGASAAGLGAFSVLAKSEITKVQAASKALSTAEAAYGKATTSKERTAALQAEAAAVQGLSPAERQLGKDLTGLSASWSALGKAESPVIAMAIGPWAAAATNGMRLLKPLVGDTGTAVGYLGKEADAAIGSPFWDKFASALGKTAESGVEGFGDAVGHLADGLGHLFVDFAPDIQKLPGLIDGWSGSFDRWATSYNKSGFENFITNAFSPGNVAALKTDLGDVATILGNVGKATLSFSPAAFTGLSNVLSILAKLSPGQITALAAIYEYSKLTSGTKLSPGSLIGQAAGSSAGQKVTGKVLGKVLGTGGAAAGEETAGAAGLGAAGLSAAGLGVGALAAGGVLFGASKVKNPDGSNWTTEGPGGKQGGWNNFGQAGSNIKNWTVNDTGNWATTGWSEVYTHFQRDFAGKVTNWFTQSLPHFFTGGVPMAWSTSYEAFQVEFAGKITSWFTQSLPHAFDATRHALGVAGTSMGHWLGDGWDASGGWLVSRFGQAGSWAQHALASSGRWLVGAGGSAAHGLVSGWDAGERAVTGAVLGARNWVNSGVVGAAKWLWNAGAAVMGGFLGGIEAGWQPVTSFVGGIAGWIKKNKGPLSYDATLLVPHGEAVMGGFYRGLVSGYGPVQGLISGIAPSIAGAASLPGVGRAVQPGALRLQVSYGSTGNALTDAIVTALRYDVDAKSGGDAQKHFGQGKART